MTAVHRCDAAERESHRSRAKKLHIRPFMDDVTRVNWLEDPFRHEKMSNDGYTGGDPVYFAQNNRRM